MSYVQIKNLSFRYDNMEKNTLKDINLNIKKGSIVAILGESGSGKSTLLRIISGFENPHQGSFELNGRLLVDSFKKTKVEDRGIGMVFQDYALFPHLTVAKNLIFGLSKEKKSRKKDILEKMLSLVNLREHIDKYPHELSGGQQQRVALARALAPAPNLILLDEPFSNLDANLQSKIRQDLKQILKESGATAIFVSHDKDDALEIADWVVIMHQGEIIQQGLPQEIYYKPKSDYVAQLFGNTFEDKRKVV